MQFTVNMKQFKENWVWIPTLFSLVIKLQKPEVLFFTFDDETYKRLLTNFNIFFTAT